METAFDPPRPQSSPQSRQRIAFTASVALIAVVTLGSLWGTQRLTQLSAELAHSEKTLLEVDRFASYLKDIETGARGYIITRDRSYLAPYHKGRESIETTARRLRVLADGQPEMHARIDALVDAAEGRIAFAQRTIAAVDRGETGQSLIPLLNGGKQAMDAVRSQADAAVAAEQEDIQARSDAVRRQLWFINIAMILGIVISLAMIMWIFWQRGREMRSSRESHLALEATNRGLEQRVEESAAEVAHSRELLAAVVENLPDAVFLKGIGENGSYLLVNDASERLFNRHRDQVVGCCDATVLPEAQLRRSREAEEKIAETLAATEPEDEIWGTEAGLRTIESRRIPLFRDHNTRQVAFVLGLLRDVTDQRTLEDQVRQLQRIDAIGQLTGGIAHDFNNLLTVMLTNVEILRDSIEDEELHEIADDAIGAVTRGAELVRRLLAFARKQHLDPESVDINNRLPNIIAMLKRSLGEKISLNVQLAPQLWNALIDATQVDDALVNLAINARDAMPGGGSLVIETANVSLDGDYADHHDEVAPGDYVMLAVSDTGTGMSPETIARAFEPFYTTKEPGKGTGLGLSQVYGWVKQSGGHIKIYSELDHGTTIKLYLPRAGSGERIRRDAMIANQPPGGTETVLAVEDDENVRRSLLRHLHDLGYKTIEARSAAEATKIIEAGTEFDLLLTDIVMPGGVTGYELASTATKLRPGLKLLFTSGYTELAAAQTERTPGQLLSKPYRKAELASAVRQALETTPA